MKDESVIFELQRIASNNGGILQPETVVKEARNPSSPLHDKFTWDDKKASHQWRLAEARGLIRVAVKVMQNGDQSTVQRIFVSLSDDRTKEHGGYRPLVNVLSDAALRSRLLDDALQELAHFRAKYSGLKELISVFEALEKIRRQHEGANQTVNIAAGQEQHELAHDGL